MMQMALGEGRTPEKYRQGVGQYIDECRETWRKRLARLVARHRVSELSIDVVNNTEDNFREVAPSHTRIECPERGSLGHDPTRVCGECTPPRLRSRSCLAPPRHRQAC